MVTLKINGESHTVDASPDMPLLWALRDLLSMNGTKFGCGVALCGACTVHLDGIPKRSCVMPVSAAAGHSITTIEGVGAMAEVAEVSALKAGEVRVHRVVCAVDCGMVVNPDTVKAQIESGIIFGISGALWGGVTLKNGRVEQSNFHDVRVMRINEAPAIEVHLARNLETPGG